MRSSLFRLGLAAGLLVLAAGCGDDDSPSAADQPAALSAEPQSGGLTSFFGRIETLAADHLTVDGRVFGIDGETRVLLQQGEASFSVLHVGSTVVVRARQNRNGAWLAREIKLRLDPPSEVKLTGRVEAVQPPDLVVAGRRVRTGPDTLYLGVGEPRSLPDVHGGDLVTVTGFEVEEGILQATKIRVESKA